MYVKPKPNTTKTQFVFHHMILTPPGPPGAPSVWGKVFKPHCGIYHGMQSTEKVTNQGIEKTTSRGNAPAPVQDRGASAGLGGQAPQNIKEVIDNGQ